MVYNTYRHYIVEQTAKNNTMIFRVWEPIKRGRYFREVKKINGKLYGRMGTKYPYIKKTISMNHEDHVRYKQELERKSQKGAYDIIGIFYPEIFNEVHMLVDGEVLVLPSEYNQHNYYIQ